jgi:hypothetical protein
LLRYRWNRSAFSRATAYDITSPWRKDTSTAAETRAVEPLRLCPGSGTALQRKILTEVGCSHQSRASFFGADQVNRAGVAKLLASMQRLSKPVLPSFSASSAASISKSGFWRRAALKRPSDTSADQA